MLMQFNLSTQAYCVAEDQLWFAARNFNGLFVMDMVRNKISFCTSFEHEGRGKQNLFLGIEKINNKLCFLPATATYVYFMDLDTGNMTSCRLPVQYLDVTYKFNKYQRISDLVYLASDMRRNVLKVNLADESIESSVWINDKGRYYEQVCEKDGKLYGLIKNSSFIYEYDLKSKTEQKIAVKASLLNQYAFIKCDENFFYLFSSADSGVVVCDEQFSIVREFYLDEGNEFGKTVRCNFIDNNLWALGSGGVLIKCSLGNWKLERIHLDNPEINEDAEELGIMGLGMIEKINDLIYLIPGDMGWLVYIDRKNNISKLPFQIDAEWVMKYILEDRNNTELLNEKKKCSLSMMLTQLADIKADESSSGRGKKNCGYTIFQQIKEI